MIFTDVSSNYQERKLCDAIKLIITIPVSPAEWITLVDFDQSQVIKHDFLEASRNKILFQLNAPENKIILSVL